jgi:hypothetical protein
MKVWAWDAVPVLVLVVAVRTEAGEHGSQFLGAVLVDDPRGHVA